MLHNISFAHSCAVSNVMCGRRGCQGECSQVNTLTVRPESVEPPPLGKGYNCPGGDFMGGGGQRTRGGRLQMGAFIGTPIKVTHLGVRHGWPVVVSSSKTEKKQLPVHHA
ncbi:hypothetical protein LSAT2_023622 [Lamellibrachia satsuma]|nr:hypothetical protein LSAT2_023622 [Lamellibrachia satsuma]